MPKLYIHRVICKGFASDRGGDFQSLLIMQGNVDNTGGLGQLHFQAIYEMRGAVWFRMWISM